MFGHNLSILNAEHDGQNAVGVEQFAEDKVRVPEEELQQRGRNEDELKATLVNFRLHFGRQRHRAGQILDGQMLKTQLAQLVLGQLEEELVKVLGPLDGARAEPTVDEEHFAAARLISGRRRVRFYIKEIRDNCSIEHMGEESFLEGKWGV